MALLYCTRNNGEYQYQNQTKNKDIMVIFFIKICMNYVTV